MKIIFVMLLAFSTYASAAVFKAIDEIQDPSIYFITTRCAGLSTSFAAWMGANPVDPDLKEQLIQDARLFAAISISDGLDSGVPLESLRKQTIEMVKSSREMYMQRFRDNFANSGSGYGNDSDVRRDAQICQLLKKK